MDYNRPLNESTNHPKVHLALIMATGAGRTQDPSTYAETPLLINPGGPGGSGVLLAQLRAQSLQLFLDGQHDIIGFDPRGVGASTPKADCFASSNSADGVLGRNVAYMNRLTWAMSGQEVGLTNSSDVALTKLSARARAMAKLCGRVDESEGDASIFRYMNTPHSARDMLSIVHAVSEPITHIYRTNFGLADPEHCSGMNGDQIIRQTRSRNRMTQNRSHPRAAKHRISRRTIRLVYEGSLYIGAFPTVPFWAPHSLPCSPTRLEESSSMV